jgi:hypothetical protein
MSLCTCDPYIELDEKCFVHGHTHRLQARVKELEAKQLGYDRMLSRGVYVESDKYVRLCKVIDVVRDCLWIDECKCDIAYTGRNLHEPNSECEKLDLVKKALLELDKTNESL